MRGMLPRSGAWALLLALLGGCGGEAAEPAAAGHGKDPPAAHHGGEPAAGGAPAGEEGVGQPSEQALVTVATQTAGALSGSDWGVVYDLSCRALVGDQSRESYIAGLSAAGSPGQLAGGTLSAGSPTTADGSEGSELPAASGEVRWVQMLQGEAIIGVARFVDDGHGFRYCGLSL